jgi:hypothetical protein
MDTNQLATLCIVALTFVSTAANVLLWVATLRTVGLTKLSIEILEREVTSQTASNYSLAKRQLINNHREVFSLILNNQLLKESFLNATQLDRQTWELRLLAQLQINNAYLGFLDLSQQIITHDYFNSFKVDTKETFSYAYVRETWVEIQQFYPEDFRAFIKREYFDDLRLT